MTSKEALKMIKIKCHPNANPNPMIDEALNNIEKDLELLEILESELKLEKDKVKYVMKQLKKQDEILDILKKNIIYYCIDDNEYKIEMTLNHDDSGFTEVLEWLKNDK